MNIKAIFFDLDGTLLPMDLTEFTECYMKRFAAMMANHGYDPELFTKSMWAGVIAMVKNDGAMTNEERFWENFSAALGKDAKSDEPLFDKFYKEEFPKVKSVCGYDERAEKAVKYAKDKGFRTVLATSPIFPKTATLTRLLWAGVEPSLFEYITAFENSSFAKPNPSYYLSLCEKLGLLPEECLMVGNDMRDDMVAATLGMKVFLLTDWLINRKDEDISCYPNGSFEELKNFIDSLN